MLHQFTDTVYHRRVYLFVGDRATFRAYIKENYGEGAARNVYKDCLGLAFSVKSPSPDDPNVESQVYFVWLTKFDGSPRTVALLAHECYHTAVAVFDNLGVNQDDEEAVAYYMDAMIEQFLTALRHEKEVYHAPVSKTAG